MQCALILESGSRVEVGPYGPEEDEYENSIWPATVQKLRSRNRQVVVRCDGENEDDVVAQGLLRPHPPPAPSSWLQEGVLVEARNPSNRLWYSGCVYLGPCEMDGRTMHRIQQTFRFKRSVVSHASLPERPSLFHILCSRLLYASCSPRSLLWTRSDRPGFGPTDTGRV